MAVQFAAAGSCQTDATCHSHHLRLSFSHLTASHKARSYPKTQKLLGTLLQTHLAEHCWFPQALRDSRGGSLPPSKAPGNGASLLLLPSSHPATTLGLNSMGNMLFQHCTSGAFCWVGNRTHLSHQLKPRYRIPSGKPVTFLAP
jgi:hypothetical protein